MLRNAKFDYELYIQEQPPIASCKSNYTFSMKKIHQSCFCLLVSILCYLSCTLSFLLYCIIPSVIAICAITRKTYQTFV